MGEVHIVGYHTCSLDNGLAHIQTHAPFHCNRERKQWLTHGYYFWTDSIHFAHEWGHQGYAGRYAIVKCSLNLDSTLLLDLVGNVEHQLYFGKLLKDYQARFAELKRTGRVPQNAEPTVSRIISHWRKKVRTDRRVFPYVAIKAQDGYSRVNIPFVDSGRECMPIPTRQQLCLFEEGYECIQNKELVHPSTV
ncbi:hypothetical protein [Thiothrix subterranea]|uniref:Uncharacterized protein n=1 Tax=Thiothrix subterranea TaxID=2735563 RepID=A0AA51MNT7_9GAMM|nr:hypothetical protein [Thiothrix subterranea]MDQ5768494.1 hypothetical protein [Thiothrix subterranea]WML87625.1 hypothetical protein RCG00_04495 [Thiothrix subterranea]